MHAQRRDKSLRGSRLTGTRAKELQAPAPSPSYRLLVSLFFFFLFPSSSPLPSPSCRPMPCLATPAPSSLAHRPSLHPSRWVVGRPCRVQSPGFKSLASGTCLCRARARRDQTDPSLISRDPVFSCESQPGLFRTVCQALIPRPQPSPASTRTAPHRTAPISQSG